LFVPARDRLVDGFPAKYRSAAQLNGSAEIAVDRGSLNKPSMVVRIALVLLAAMAAGPVWADEICKYSGSTSQSGHATVETKAAIANGETTVDVTTRVGARTFGIFDWQYLYQEIATFRDRELRSVAVNRRYSVAGSIRRQQWDFFTRGQDGMSAYRVQANTLADFQIKHPGFLRHWDPASFGQPWLPDYRTAPPERRADLDLPKAAMPPGLGTPLAMGFYWVRWAGQADRSVRTIPVFLPGFKKNSRVDVGFTSIGVEANGLLHVRSEVRHPQLSETKASTADAWIAPDHHLVRLTFDARSDYGSAEGELRLDGCRGEAPTR
jgi:hypothetical protein